MIWKTPSAPLMEAVKGDFYNANIQYIPQNEDEFVSFSIVSGELPPSISLNTSYANVVNLSGNIGVNDESGIYDFTLRGKGYNLSDRTFSINVSDVQNSNVFPSSNIGVFEDGTYVYANISPLMPIPSLLGNIQITSGELPSALSLDGNGIISGFIYPSTLYIPNSFNPNMEGGASSLPSSANSANYSFSVSYDANNSASYNLSVVRQSPFNETGNVDYHNPVFLNDGNNVINVPVFDGHNFLYQIDAYDWDDNTLVYTCSDGNTIQTPWGNLILNTSTGWISGNVNPTLAPSEPYFFNVDVYKKIDSSYSATANVALHIQNPLLNSLVWESDSNLGSINAGVPCTLEVSANIVKPFTTPVTINAIANCAMRVNSVSIVNGGVSFSVGQSLTLSGGKCINPAILTISSVSSIGSITGISVDSRIQGYTELPPLMMIWENSNALNAEVSLNFGVESVSVQSEGAFYDTAMVEFSYTEESSPASAIATINNGFVTNITIIDGGQNYPAVPSVFVSGLAYVEAPIPIRYTLAPDSSLPPGLSLDYDGKIVGLPSSYNGNSTYTFEIVAAIGQNTIEVITEEDVPYPNNTVEQDFQSIIQTSKTFSLYVNGNSTPRTNLSVEFLIDNDDYSNIYTPIFNESIVPNDAIFRASDPNFGIQENLRMLVGYGMTLEDADSIQYAISQFHYPVQYTFTSLSWATSTSEGYDVIYINPTNVYTLENGNTWNEFTHNVASVPNMIQQLHNRLSSFDNGYLPTWMTDLQTNGTILGYIPAIPILYVKSGLGASICYELSVNYGNSLIEVEAMGDRYYWNNGYSQNYDFKPLIIAQGSNSFTISQPSTFYANLSTPLNWTANLFPITYEYASNSNVMITLPYATSIVANASLQINNNFVLGLESQVDENGNILLIGHNGTPYTLTDGNNSPLSIMGINTGNIGNVTLPHWNDSNTTEDGRYILFERTSSTWLA